MNSTTYLVRAWRIAILVAIACLLAADLSIAAPVISFTPLGDLPGGEYFSLADGVSANGQVVVGVSSAGFFGEAIQWTASGGMSPLGPAALGQFNQAYATSADGTIAVGRIQGSSTEAVRWVGGTRIGLGDLAGGQFYSEAHGISADGSVIVGIGTSAAGYEAALWKNGGAAGLGDLAGGTFFSFATDVSADGAIVVGRSDSTAGSQAFRWTEGGGMVGLGDLPGGSFYSEANGISADGSVIVGTSVSSSGTEAFRWLSGVGMIGLGDLPGGQFHSVAEAASSDGSAIVGFSVSDAGEQAYLWTASGMRAIEDILSDAGLGTSLAGWKLQRATDISSDGRTIVGYGLNPQGRNEAWIATVPEPSTWVLIACGVASLPFMATRRRQHLRNFAA